MKTQLLALVASFSVCAYSSEAAPIENNHHRIYVEPDFSWNIAHKYQEESLTVKEWGQYYGINAGYEFLKANDFYAGIETFVSLGNRFTEVRGFDQKLFDSEDRAAKSKIEGRAGYNLIKNNISLTPFSGAGGYFISQNDIYLNLAYIPLGIKAEYRWSALSVGLKGEQMHFIHYWLRAHHSKESGRVWGTSAYGYELSLPISFKTDLAGGKWHGAVEPYYLKLFDDLSFLGGRISAIYQY